MNNRSYREQSHLTLSNVGLNPYTYDFFRFNCCRHNDGWMVCWCWWITCHALLGIITWARYEQICLCHEPDGGNCEKVSKWRLVRWTLTKILREDTEKLSVIFLTLKTIFSCERFIILRFHYNFYSSSCAQIQSI